MTGRPVAGPGMDQCEEEAARAMEPSDHVGSLKPSGSAVSAHSPISGAMQEEVESGVQLFGSGAVCRSWPSFLCTCEAQLAGPNAVETDLGPDGGKSR